MPEHCLSLLTAVSYTPPPPPPPLQASLQRRRRRRTSQQRRGLHGRPSHHYTSGLCEDTEAFFVFQPQSLRKLLSSLNHKQPIKCRIPRSENSQLYVIRQPFERIYGLLEDPNILVGWVLLPLGML